MKDNSLDYIETMIEACLDRTRRTSRIEPETVTNYCARCARGRRWEKQGRTCPDMPAAGYAARPDLWAPPDCYMWG